MTTTIQPIPLAILGGGPAGLAAGYFAQKRGLPFTVFETSGEVGGNCRTVQHGDFRFDTGAHRFHDKDAEITAEIQVLLGEDLLRAEVPSQIVFNGQRIDFPLSPLDLLKKLGVPKTILAASDLARARFAGLPEFPNFAESAHHRYGQTIAQAFLLDYSEKLWGERAEKLSPLVSGQRLKGLDLKTFLIEALSGQRKKTAHLDGSFFYPRYGIGIIPQKLAEACGAETIHLNARITKLLHDGHRITEIMVNDNPPLPVDRVISSLPLSTLIKILEPKVPHNILECANQLEFQNIILVVLFLNTPQCTQAATLYFPDKDVPFTRASEPKNRSAAMAPEHQTSLMVEIPCRATHALWTEAENAIIQQTQRALIEREIISERDFLGGTVHRIPFAYPVLKIGFETVVGELTDYLRQFANLHLTGRSGCFAYTHVHDLLRAGRDAIFTM